MARVKPDLFSLSGKVKNKVFVQHKKYGEIVREAPKPGSKKNEPSFKKEYNRTQVLNKLASEVNKIINIYGDALKPSDFYQRLQALFRKEALDHRLLLLWQLKGIDINPKYPMHKLGDNKLTIADLKNSIEVNLATQSHPLQGKYKADCYYYEVLLICWDNSKKPATHSRQYSDWIYLNEGFPEFEFLFPKPDGVTHWVVCLKQQLGKNAQEITSLAATSMQIAEVGTFNKKDQELLNEKIAAQNKERTPKEIKRKVDDVIRVKAKKMRKDEIVSPK